MHRVRVSTFSVAATVAMALVAGCSSEAASAEKITPVVLDTIPDSKLKQVTLTADAAERIGLVTGKITSGGGSEITVPYGAVIYDPDGAAWAYVVKGDHVYLREELTIDRIVDDVVYLSAGPAVGTEVAVIGVAELFGAETGIGK
jgi:hypothetical protein